ncbi:signal peptidase I [Fredinandcohnia sp. QZ13]|uniref:signal peptidase I n=1 Tax=Fredinandcohnia sp. QZ13 TaxID=3073144 RepID=UPI0028533D7E|nr:signal peptidase I [Fredinandcohnia sp. QZ13]MDR4887569.1 signal peptidase I [Fredinandcohnia sp. QZ13]
MKKILVFILMVFTVLIILGCSINGSSETLTDENTTPDVTVIENLGSEMITHHHMSDNMDRGNHDYFDKTLTIETNISVADISRGDVVFFDNEGGEKDISRVVALPGEKIKITKGQIYINGQKLDTFYGKAHRLGLDEKGYLEMMDKDYDKKGMMEIFERSMREVKLSDDEYYLIGDDWFRGKMMILKEEKFIGKVVGYAK